MEELSSSGGGADDDLLERARRLCLAAQMISDSLPKFSIGAAQRSSSGGNQDEETASGTKKPKGNAAKSSSSAGGLPRAKERLVDPDTCSACFGNVGKTKSEASNQSSLPATVLPVTPPPQVTRKRPLKQKQKSVLGSTTNQESLPEIAISDEQRKAREAEKVRQAQERARARVARTNQSDQLEAEREIEMRKQQLQRLEEVSAEKERLVEQSRLRAEERIRPKRQLSAQLNPIERQHSPVCPPEKPQADPAKIERFRMKTLARLHAYNLYFVVAFGVLPRTTTPKAFELQHQADLGESVTEMNSPERGEDLEAETKKQKEKKLRQETAERIRRHHAVEEDQRRKEQELIQQGLLQYKNRQKELDRVAKGLGPPRKINSVSKQTAEVRPHSGASHSETVALVQDQSLKDGRQGEAPADNTQAMVEGSHSLRYESGTFGVQQPVSPEYDESEPHDHWAASTGREADQPPSLAISLDPPKDQTAPSVSSATSGGKPKLPPWKRALVPVLPAEFYSSKAVIPAAPSTTPSVSATPSNSYTEKFKSRAPSTSNTNSSSSASSKLRATRPRSREGASPSSGTAPVSRLGSATRS